MASELPTNKLPSLVQYCLRILVQQPESIAGFGNNARFGLIKPILDYCDPMTLSRLEDASPHLEQDTNIIWQDFCYRDFSLEMDEYRKGVKLEPQSWKEVYFVIKYAKEARLREVTSRIRSQRQEEEGRKKEKEIKITDCVPPTKRARIDGWGNYQPKTLLQKTRTEASRLHKNMYQAPKFPLRHVKPTVSITPPPTPPCLSIINKLVHRTRNAIEPESASKSPKQSCTTGVTVRTIVVRQLANNADTDPKPTITKPSNSPVSPKSTKLTRTSPATPNPKKSVISPPPLNIVPPLPTTLPRSDINLSPSPRPLGKLSSKKDPMATLFMPKHRALSQCRK